MSTSTAVSHSSAPRSPSVHPSGHFCQVCGGLMTAGASYRAKDDVTSTIHEFPARACGRCGYICPDEALIDELPPARVPSSIRMRCARRA